MAVARCLAAVVDLPRWREARASGPRLLRRTQGLGSDAYLQRTVFHGVAVAWQEVMGKPTDNGRGLVTEGRCMIHDKHGDGSPHFRR